MKVTTTGSVNHDGQDIPPGTDLYMPDEQAFPLVRGGFAKPGNRYSERVYQEMLSKAPDPGGWVEMEPTDPARSARSAWADDMRKRFAEINQGPQYIGNPKPTTLRVRDGRIVGGASDQSTEE